MMSSVSRPPSVRSRSGAESGVRVRPGESEEDDGPDYPAPTTETVDEAAADLLDELDGTIDWSERYEFLIELGHKAPILPDSMRTDENRVKGCQSTVYLAPRIRPGTRDVVEFLADSDSEVVRGLLALLQLLFSGQRAGDLLAFDLLQFLARAGLDANLTTGRRNGLAEMIKRLRGFAAAADKTRETAVKRDALAWPPPELTSHAPTHVRTDSTS